MFKCYANPREFKICMYCPNGSEFISFEKVESEFDLAVTIESIFVLNITMFMNYSLSKTKLMKWKNGFL